MKKLLLLFVFFSAVFSAFADRTISYGQISSYCPQTGQMLGGGAVIAVTIGDGYIIHPLYGEMYEAGTNMDGSTTYIPSGYAGTPAMQCNAVLISANLQSLEERMTSTMGNMSLNLINTYTNAGEDGGRYAESWSNAQAASRSGGSSGRNSRYSSGVCSSCGGTGVNKMPNSGGSRTNWVAYYNQSGSECPYCGRYTSHYHDKCASCNVPR